MIRKLVLRRFKRFAEATFELPGHVVLAGPNNTGKTTALQAIAAWALALDRWKRLNDFQRHGGAYTKAPVTRQIFFAVPLRVFDLLWTERNSNQPLEVELESSRGWTVVMEFIADSSEQIYVRPKPNIDPAILRSISLPVVFVPAMTGLSAEEPVYQPAKIDQLLGQAKPGDVLRNLLVQAHQSESAWAALQESLRRLFNYELLPPNAEGADILAEYRIPDTRTELDISSAGSGLQQVLMLLTFLNTRPGSILLLDEPDAHLHVILQDAIFSELRAAATQTQSQLIIATHSEVIINSLEPRELCVIFRTPRMLADSQEKSTLIRSLGILTNQDILLAEDAPGILYLEDYTDLEILRAWAKTLGHRAQEVLTTQLSWKKTVSQPRTGAAGIAAKDHYDALKLVRNDLPGLELLDGDARAEILATPITGQGLQRRRWKRYEIESYLLHPNALARFVEHIVGKSQAATHLEDLWKHFAEKHPPDFLKNPLDDLPYLIGTKARTELLPPALTAAGLPAIPYTRYHEIAAQMKPEEIHPEVIETLDTILKAFRIS